MNEQPPEALTLWSMVPWSGSFGMFVFYLSLAILIIIPLLFVCLKNRRSFLIWLTDQNIKFNLLSGVCLLIWGIFKAAQFSNTYSFEKHFMNVNKEICSLIPIAFVSLALFGVKFGLELILKLKAKKQTEPAVGAYRENAR